jgi:hypothetical protein
MSDGFRERLLSIGEDGTALHTSTTKTSLLPASRKFTLPSYFFDRIGKSIIVEASGRISTKASAVGTLQLFVDFGSTAVFSSGPFTPVASLTNASWLFRAELTCRVIGTSAQLLGVGVFQSAAAPDGTSLVLPATAPAVGTAFDATASQTVDFDAQWQTSDASNSILLHQFSLDVYT